MTSLGWVDGESLSRNKDFATLTRNAAPKSRLKRGVVAAAIQLEKHNTKSYKFVLQKFSLELSLRGKMYCYFINE